VHRWPIVLRTFPSTPRRPRTRRSSAPGSGVGTLTLGTGRTLVIRGAVRRVPFAAFPSLARVP
jgi:hypothetical protein